MTKTKRSASEWVEAISAFEASGKTLSAFAKEIGVTNQALGWAAWRYREVVQLSRARPQTLSLVELSPKRDEPILLTLVGGQTLRIPSDFDADTLRRVVEAIDGRAP